VIKLEYKVPQLEPYVGEEELKNLEIVIKSKWLTEGPFAKEFLERIQDFTKAKYALLASNGTLGLFLCLLGCEIKKGDEVIVSDFTFNASASSIAFTGATPVFVDVSGTDLNMDAAKIEEKITPRTKAIMPVNVYGQSCDMDPIMKIAKKHNLMVIEDSAQCFGVFYKGKHSGTIGDVGMISFFADKTITTGEGAVILTDDEAIYERIKLLRNQGRPHSSTFIHPALGMNFRMTDLQCAVGVAQIKKFKDIEKIKMNNYALYKTLLKEVKEVKLVDENNYSNIVPFRSNILANNLEKLLVYMEENGIQTRRFFYPMHKQPCYSYLNSDDKDFPVSNMAYEKGLSLPIFCSLTVEQIKYVCEKIKEFYEDENNNPDK